MSIMKQPRMTKLLGRMEAQGLVERRPDPADRRRVLIHPTEAGRARVAPVLEAAKAHEARVMAPFTSEERALIKHALDLLIEKREQAG
jgi:DNA-binding MarR family transcriptional regulator